MTQANLIKLQAEYDRLQRIIARGASSAVIDGQKITYDLKFARERMRDLSRVLHPELRPRMSTIFIGGSQQ